MQAIAVIIVVYYDSHDLYLIIVHYDNGLVS